MGQAKRDLKANKRKGGRPASPTAKVSRVETTGGGVKNLRPRKDVNLDGLSDIILAAGLAAARRIHKHGG